MVDGQTIATFGVGVGVLLILLDQTTPGLVFMILGIAGFAAVELWSTGGGERQR